MTTFPYKSLDDLRREKRAAARGRAMPERLKKTLFYFDMVLSKGNEGWKLTPTPKFRMEQEK